MTLLSTYRPTGASEDSFCLEDQQLYTITVTLSSLDSAITITGSGSATFSTKDPGCTGFSGAISPTTGNALDTIFVYTATRETTNSQCQYEYGMCKLATDKCKSRVPIERSDSATLSAEMFERL